MTDKKTDAKQTDSPAPQDPKLVTVTLSTPISRSGGDVTALTLRKPNSGELRGLSLLQLAEFHVNTLHTLLPRITQPALTQAELNAMDIADLFALAGKINDFLQPNSVTEGQSPAE